MNTNTLMTTMIATGALSIAACSSNPKMAEPTAAPHAESSQSSEHEGYALKERDPFAAERAAAERELVDKRLVHFDFDRASLRPEAEMIIAKHARYLISNPGTALRLEGHADERGTREYNVALGERRARNVLRALQLRGVNADRIKLVSYGEEQPMVLGAAREQSFARNRRVEFNYQSGVMANAPLSYENPVTADEAMSANSTPRTHEDAGTATESNPPSGS